MGLARHHRGHARLYRVGGAPSAAAPGTSSQPCHPSRFGSRSGHQHRNPSVGTGHYSGRAPKLRQRFLETGQARILSGPASARGRLARPPGKIGMGGPRRRPGTQRPAQRTGGFRLHQAPLHPPAARLRPRSPFGDWRPERLQRPGLHAGRRQQRHLPGPRRHPVVAAAGQKPVARPVVAGPDQPRLPDIARPRGREGI